MFVDFHVHPNLPKFRTAPLLEKWWKGIHRVGLDGLVITEHAYKNPERAYREMVKNQPRTSKVLVFPGVEALTKEGIDVLAFAKTDKIYDYEELVTPKKLDMDEMIAFLKKKRDVVGVIPHPFTPGLTGIVAHKGEAYARTAVAQIGAVEVHNGAMLGILNALHQTGLRHVCRGSYENAQKTWNLPKSFYPKNPGLLTAGSDAHYPDCLGAGVVISKKWKSRDQAFKVISTARGKIVKQKACHPYRDMFTVLSEWLIKKFV